MSLRRMLLTFVLAFALGIMTTVFLLQHDREAPATAVAEPPSTAAPSQQKPDADAPPAAPNDDTDDDTAEWPEDAGTPEQVLYAQAQMMDDAVARLEARAPGRPNLYLIAFAGDGGENVFRNEAEYVEKLFNERFGTLGHAIVLINNPATLTRYPIASLSNLQSAVDAIAEKMDPEQDVLFLLLTSHGSRDHELHVALDPLPLDQIDPDDVADLFTDTKIRNKVVVISACYSGGFIDALRGPSTMVITAARADRSSFGCGTQSAITDFGRAFFVNGLNDNDNFPGAFAEARRLIEQWETRAGQEHSEPQLASTPQIEGRLRAWRDAIHPGPPVPFQAPGKDLTKDASPTLTAWR